MSTEPEIALKDKGKNKYMTPRQAIRQHCLDCCLGNRAEVTACVSTTCVLYPYRTGHRVEGQTMTPLKAIRAYCLACGEPGKPISVRNCPIKNCSLYQFRFGHNPYRKGERKNGQFISNFVADEGV